MNGRMYAWSSVRREGVCFELELAMKYKIEGVLP